MSEVIVLNLAYLAVVASVLTTRTMAMRLTLAVASGFFAAYFIIAGQPTGWIWNIGFTVGHLIQADHAYRKERDHNRRREP